MTPTISNEQQARPASYSITSARYAKKSIAVHCKPDGSGFKTLEMHATESIGGRWSNREKAYILPASKEARLRQLIADGWDARMKFTGTKHKWELEAPTDEQRAKEAGCED